MAEEISKLKEWNVPTPPDGQITTDNFRDELQNNLGYYNTPTQLGQGAGTNSQGTFTSNDTNLVTSVFTGENITAGNSVCLINDTAQLYIDNDYAMGTAASEKKATKFVPATKITAQTLKFFLKKQGAPADNLTWSIQTDSSSLPSGSVVTNATQTIAGASLTTRRTYTSSTTSSAFTLEAGVTYWLVFERSGATSGTDYYVIAGYSDDYANYSGANYTAAAWAAQANTLLFFETTVASGNQTLVAWNTDSDNLALSDFFGFANANANKNNLLNVTYGGVHNQVSGLTTSKPYFVGSTAGSISTTKGTFGNIIGLAVDANKIMIQKQPKIMSGGETFTFGGSGGVEEHYYNVGFRPRIIYFEAGGSGSGLGESRGVIYSASDQNCIYNNLGSGTANAATARTTSYCAFLVSASMTEQKNATVTTINEGGFSIGFGDTAVTSQSIIVQWHAIG